MIPSNRVLAKIAVYGSVACISAVMYARSKIQDNIRNAEHFREAMKVLRTNSGQTTDVVPISNEVSFLSAEKFNSINNLL